LPRPVDVIQPPSSFDLATDKAVYDFLDAHVGAMDMHGQVGGGGREFICHCFIKEQEANEFHARFATDGEVINFPKAVNG